MTAAGWLHVIAVCLAAASAGLVLGGQKGTALHRVQGRIYLGAMLFVNAAAFLIHQDADGWGPFHLLAVVSLLTLLTGLWLIRRRPRTATGITSHAHVMGWSVVGLVSAGVGQAAAASNLPVWPAILVTLAVGGGLIYSAGLHKTARALLGTTDDS